MTKRARSSFSSVFMPAAERNDLMKSIDRWVIGAAMAFCAARKPGALFVRLSQESMTDATLPGWLANQLKSKDMALELTEKAKSLLAKRGFDPVLGARPLRRTIQREIEDQLSEKILFEEVGPGQVVTVDVDNWDGEGAGEDAVFTFTGTRKPPVEEDLAKTGAHSAPDAQ